MSFGWKLSKMQAKVYLLERLQIMSYLHTLFYNVVPFLIVLSFLVFIHELGHYLLAKMNKVRVEVFSIGFGKEIVGWTDKSGTRWKISILPLGGYVRMFSDANAASQPDAEAIRIMTEEEKAVSLFHKNVWQRISISAAGPLANYILAIVLFTFLYSTVGQRIPTTDATIGAVISNHPAAIAGLKEGDKIVSLDDTAISNFKDVLLYINEKANVPVKFTVNRGDETLNFTVTPEAKVDHGKTVGRVGMAQGFERKILNPFDAFASGVSDTINVTVATLKSIGRMLTGQQSADGLSGPLGIASMVSDVAQKNLSDLIELAAFLSVSLGLLNFFPIPMLDGGHLLFYFIEAIRGKPVSERAQEIAYRIGFALLMTLVFFTTWNDLSRLKIVTYIKNLF